MWPFIRLAGTAALALTLAACSKDAPEKSTAPPASQKVTVELVTVEKRHIDLDIRQKVQFAKVKGLADPDLAGRVNARLEAAATKPLQDFQDQIAFPDDAQPLDPSVPRTGLLTSEATVGLRGPRLVSVGYRLDTDGGEFGRFVAWSSTSVVIDLADGRELGTRDLLAERAGTAQGARELGDLLAEYGEGGRLCDVGEPSRPFNASDFRSDEPIAELWPQAKGLTFRLALSKIGYPMACHPTEITVPYPALGALAGPPLADQLSG